MNNKELECSIKTKEFLLFALNQLHPNHSHQNLLRHQLQLQHLVLHQHLKLLQLHRRLIATIQLLMQLSKEKKNRDKKIFSLPSSSVMAAPNLTTKSAISSLTDVQQRAVHASIAKETYIMV